MDFTLDTATSFASLVSSAVLASVALLFTFRQNIGWAPLAFVTSTSIQGQGGQNVLKFVLTVEFWNRRKYPVVLRSVSMAVAGFPIYVDEDTRRRGGGPHNNVDFRKLEASVDPSQCHRFDMSAVFKGQALDAMQPSVEFSIVYFDPISNKTAALKVPYRIFYPELGWQKTEEERTALAMRFVEKYGPNFDAIADENF